MDLGGFCICYSVKHFTYFDTNIVTIPIFSTLDPFFAFNSQTMSWASPDSNCSFSYVVNSTSNGSLVAQHRTNTTSLTVTDLSVATMYHFAVAVEDADLTTGSWSEVVDILWDGKYSLNVKNFVY